MKFGKIFNSIKKSDRTDKIAVLTALFCLGADKNPVTSRQIGDLLRLHLNSNSPDSLNTHLRRLSKYVTIAEKGPPLKWALLDDGLKHLEELTGSNLSSTVSSVHGADVAIICALEFPEFEAVIKASGGAAAWNEVKDPQFAHVYRETTIVTAGGVSLKVIGVTSTSMGLTAAAIATTQMLMRYRPKVVAMVGIAAGTYDGKKKFGDILVADPSVDYSSGKVVFAKGVREFLPDPYPIGLNPRLRSLLQKYRGDHELMNEIKTKWTRSAPGGSLKLHLGPLGAADQVIDDASRVLEIQKNWRKLIGVEMETYGVYRACFESPDPKPRFVSFKSVCDFAAHKADSWQSYAAFTAAGFAIRFFQLEWESLWPKNN